MSKIIIKICFVFIILLALSSKMFSIEKVFERINMASGIAHNTTLCLLEDHDGYIWIGTRDGLNRYDGVNFETYKHRFGDSTCIVSDRINCLIQSKNKGKGIWIGTIDGLSYYDKHSKQFKSYRFSPKGVQLNTNTIRTVFEANENELLIGTSHGLIIFDPHQETYSHLLIAQETASKANGIRIIFQDSKRNIWIGTDDGLYRFVQNKFIKIQLNTETASDPIIVREVVEEQDGLLWVGTENHGVIVFSIDNEKVTIKSYLNTSNSGLSSNTIRTIFFENQNTVWIGTFEGINIYHKETNDFILHSPKTKINGDISHTSIRDIISDSSGGIWVATYLGGVNYYNKAKVLFKHITWFSSPNTSLNSNIASVLIEDGDSLWIGTEGGGLYLSEDKGNTISKRLNSSNSELPHNSIKSLQIGGGKLWIGTLRGLSTYDFKTQKITSYMHSSESRNSLLQGHVAALFYESKERIWVGTLGGGLQVYNSVTNSFSTIDEFNGKMITCLFFDSAKQLWIGTESEVIVFNTNEKRVIDMQEKVENWDSNFTFVSFITEDTAKNVWVGTLGRGLFLIKNNEMYWYNSSNGLEDNSINALLEGDQSQYWIATNKGLSKIELFFENKEVPNLKAQSYSLAQGLQGLQFSPNCALKSRSGILIFGGTNGLNKFFHCDINETDFHPNLVLEDLRINNQVKKPGERGAPLSKRLNEIGHLKLKYSQNDFSISFSGINFINPEKNIYRYKVEGINNSWIETGKQNSINFIYFPVGTFEIKLQVTTNPENWGSNYRSLIVTVFPPWWKSWWAFIIYAFVVFTMLTLFFMLIQLWARMKNQLVMQQFKQEKESELHQLKLKFYTDVSHELRTPLTLILAPLENLISKSDFSIRFRNQLIQIQRNGFRLMQLINQILDLRKLETGHLQLRLAEGNIICFLEEISLGFKEVATSRNINFDFLPHKKQLLLWYDRDKLEIIVNNLISNALKYTPSGGNVMLKLAEVDGNTCLKEFQRVNTDVNYLKISIMNEGSGVSSEDLENVFKRFYSSGEKGNDSVSGVGVGLELTKRMIELHRGNISVTSEGTDSKNKLTVFSIYLSLGRQVYLEDEIDDEFINSEDPSFYKVEFLKQGLEKINDEKETEKLQPTRNGTGERLLIVEDNQEVRNFINELFADEYDISEAENGEIGLQKAIEINPQLIISDVMMPVLDGIELCKRIKTDPRTSHIPIILLTARTSVTFKYEGLETGADDYITKPFSAKYLTIRVKNLIKQRRSLQEYFKREVICDPGNLALTSLDEKILKKAVDYMTENMDNPKINVNIISAYVGLSRVHFYRKIKALTNLSPVEFIRSLRLKRAASLLEQKKVSVKEIQYMVGFEDRDYFRKCFKKQFGVTPSEYQNKS